MSEKLNAFAALHRPAIEARLQQRCPRSVLAGTFNLNEALRNAVSCGGKRIRPLLTLLAASSLGVPTEDVLEIACGVEFLHLSSVILDDLPAMDDAQMRYHRPALHILYGEATAILAAMALYAEAFGIFSQWPSVVREAVRAVGCDGMAGGQAADLLGVRPSLLAKTTSLIRFALTAGALAAQAPPEPLRALARFGELIGEAYQICDDLMDELATESYTGKSVGQDRRHGRSALDAGCGLESALTRACLLVEAAVKTLNEGLSPYGETDTLCDFAETIIQRINDLVEGNHVDAGGSRRAAHASGAECDVMAADPDRRGRSR